MQPSNISEKIAIATLEALGILERNGTSNRWVSAQADAVRNLDAFTHRLLLLESGHEGDSEEETVVSLHLTHQAAQRNTRALHATFNNLGGKPALDGFLSGLPSKHRATSAILPALGPLPPDFEKTSRVQPCDMKIEAQCLDFHVLASQFETWAGADHDVSRLSSPRPTISGAESLQAKRGLATSPRPQPIRRPSTGHDSNDPLRFSSRQAPGEPLGRANSDLLTFPQSAAPSIAPASLSDLTSPKDNGGRHSPPLSAWPNTSSTSPEPFSNHASVRLPQWSVNPIELGQGPGDDIISDEAMLAIHDAALEKFRVKFESDLKKPPKIGDRTRSDGVKRPSSRSGSVKTDSKRRRDRERQSSSVSPVAPSPVVEGNSTQQQY